VTDRDPSIDAATGDWPTAEDGRDAALADLAAHADAEAAPLYAETLDALAAEDPEAPEPEADQ
jgi:hypothetical protein